MMTPEQSNVAVWALVNDALDAAGDSPPLAASLLIDAAASIIVSRLTGDGAFEMADMLGQYLDRIVTLGIVDGGKE